jgi:TctA family transporter
MQTVRRSYYLLMAIVILPVLVYFFGAAWELLYSVICLLILGCFVAVIYLIQSQRRSENNKDVESDLHRQISVVMIFVIAGIISAWHFYAGYSARSVEWSTLTEVVAWGVYGWGIVYMLYGAIRFFHAHGFR